MDSSPACDGHRQGLEWVGAGGMRCCFLHANVFGKLAAAQQRIQQLEAMTPFGEDFKTLARRLITVHDNRHQGLEGRGGGNWQQGRPESAPALGS